MIKKIIIRKGERTIKSDFEISLGKITTITGENNVGKTNFLICTNNEKDAPEFQDESGSLIVPKIVYIAAENIRPSDNECKPSAKTSGLIQNLADLFSDLGIVLELKEESGVYGELEGLFEKANINLQNFTGKNTHILELERSKKLDPKAIIQLLIKNIAVDEGGQSRELDELGQGTQRIIVASILKAYADILVEKKMHSEKPVLIIFEEPEIYLHPKLKRSLNSTLEKIAEQDNHQILIITHDPYFAFKNLEANDRIIYSFEKDSDGKTVISDKPISGIEDELLFIFLYSLIAEKDHTLLSSNIPNFVKRTYYRDNKNGATEENHTDLKYIRHQIHHFGDNQFTLGLVKETPQDTENKNWYTENELSEAIKLMSGIYGNIR